MRFKWAISLLTALICSNTSAATFHNERLSYQIIYHWGIIWKHAGSATLTLEENGDNYETLLAARTVSWADRIFKVRDTLACTIKKEGLMPLRYIKAAHEGKGIVHDTVRYMYGKDGNITAQCVHHRAGRAIQHIELHSQGRSLDMLSVFYYIRTIDFAQMRQGAITEITVFSGRRKETLRIKYSGIEEIELRDKSRHKAFHVKFAFTQDGQTKSSDDLDTWISTDSSRIPLMLCGKLPIGEIRCYYVK